MNLQLLFISHLQNHTVCQGALAAPPLQLWSIEEEVIRHSSESISRGFNPPLIEDR